MGVRGRRVEGKRRGKERCEREGEREVSRREGKSEIFCSE